MIALDTIYKGTYFRSRLEARWAVFFDVLGIEWEYEPQGFQLKNGIRYLPDFWLPSFDGGMWCEVKPLSGGPEKWAKAEAFALECKRPVWLCEGIPALRGYTVLSGDEQGLYDWGDSIPNFDQAFGENRMYVQASYLNADGSIPDECLDYYGSQQLVAAVEAAIKFRP